LAYDSGKGEVFVGNMGDNTVSVISVGAAPATTSTSSLATSSSVATTSSPASTQSASTTSQNSVQTTTSSSSSGGGVPVFPYQFAIAAVFTLLLAASYLLVRRRTALSGRPGQN
jgi:hypothetical protein